MSLSYELIANDGNARRGRVTTRRGTFETPVFMPVGTRGAVIHLDARDYVDLGMEVVLGNTYHLMLRPGAEVVKNMGGLHSFTNWDGHMLTDSDRSTSLPHGCRRPCPSSRRNWRRRRHV